MPMPRLDAETRAFFEAILPPDSRVRLRPMFGNLAAFVNGNMFAGVFGTLVFLRLGPDDRAALLREPGAAVFAPMEGRPMKEYVVLPAAWQPGPEPAGDWARRSLAWAAALPPKEPKQKKPGRR